MGLLRASVDVSLLPVVEACVVVAVRGRVGEVRVAADEATAPRLPKSDTPAVAWSPSHACGPWHGEFSEVSPHGRIVRQLMTTRTPHIEERGPSAWHRRTQPKDTKYYGIHQSIAVRGG